ncbi:MAG TPA: NYN domain-containing protein [Lacipirellulaceae bacterium]|nr:NYN domain-containing protein [Lacipirellulaceae bacterium]
MALLIDGYNLLHVTGLVGPPGSGLRGSRDALLSFLANALDARERRETVVVFDAAEAPPGLPSAANAYGIAVRYAANYPEADDLLEELIAAHNAPRSLTVVSSDHRVQAAARRRKAAFVDSDVWYAEAHRRLHLAQNRHAEDPDGKPSTSAEESARYVEEFSRLASEVDGPPSPNSRDDDNPFPPGFGEDLNESLDP